MSGIEMQGPVGSIVCKLIGHWWKEDQPAVLINSPHRRLKCRWCGTMKWSFNTETAEEMEKLQDMIFGNRAAKRKAEKRK